MEEGDKDRQAGLKKPFQERFVTAVGLFGLVEEKKLRFDGSVDGMEFRTDLE